MGSHNTVLKPEIFIIKMERLVIEDSVVKEDVTNALREDVGSGDITAGLIDESTQLNARVITREHAVIAGQRWVNAVYSSLDKNVVISWKVKDGDKVEPNQTLFKISGPARSVLTGERTALNFLQLLSATATITNQYVQRISHTSCRLLDTRKTIPGLRMAQKYAVTCGGGKNHRIGLYDAFLIKENHIAACGGITNAVENAKKSHPNCPIEVEVENLEELDQAQKAGANIIMLDNFTPELMRKAVQVRGKDVKFEASGNVNLETISSIAETGVDFISVGALTKNIKAIDLSMRYTQ